MVYYGSREAAKLLKFTSSQLQDGERLLDFKWLNRHNLVADCLFALKFGTMLHYYWFAEAVTSSCNASQLPPFLICTTLKLALKLFFHFWANRLLTKVNYVNITYGMHWNACPRAGHRAFLDSFSSNLYCCSSRMLNLQEAQLPQRQRELAVVSPFKVIQDDRCMFVRIESPYMWLPCDKPVHDGRRSRTRG